MIIDVCWLIPSGVFVMTHTASYKPYGDGHSLYVLTTLIFTESVIGIQDDQWVNLKNHPNHLESARWPMHFVLRLCSHAQASDEKHIC